MDNSNSLLRRSLLDELAKKYCKAEADRELLQEKRKSVFTKILDAEDRGESKKNQELKDQLAIVDQNLELLKSRIESTKEKMESVAEDYLKSRVKKIKDEKNQLEILKVKSEQQLAEYLEGVKIFAESLGFSQIVKSVEQLFKAPFYGAENLPENERMIEHIREAAGRIPKPVNLKQKRSEILGMEMLRTNPNLIKNNAGSLVKKAIGRVRRGET